MGTRREGEGEGKRETFERGKSAKGKRRTVASDGLGEINEMFGVKLKGF